MIAPRCGRARVPARHGVAYIVDITEYFTDLRRTEKGSRGRDPSPALGKTTIAP